MDLSQELVKFNVTDAAIAKMNQDYMKLSVKGIEDKAGYASVHSARMVVKGKRVEVEKKGKELRADALAYQKAVIAEEKRIIALLEPIESHLAAEEKKVDDELERIKQEALEKKRLMVQARINSVFSFGATYDGSNYSVLGVTISGEWLAGCTPEQFTDLEAKITSLRDAENARLAEIEAKRKEEEERLAKIAAEQEAERKRLEAVAQEQARKEAEARAEIERREAAVKAEADRIAAEKKAIEDAKIKAAEEKALQERIEKERLEAMERARTEEAERIKREAAEKAERERLAKLEAERIESLRPDKDKLLAFADALDKITFPDLATEDGKRIITDTRSSILQATKVLRKKALALTGEAEREAA